MSLVAKATPSVLQWARETAGLGLEQIAEKLNFSPERLKAIESGREEISVAKLRDISNYYKRPLAAFFLPEPPKTTPLPKDFRTLPGDQKLPLSPKSLILIRKAIQLQKDASELAVDLEIVAPSVKKLSLSVDPEKESANFRKIPIEKQLKWRDASEAFSQWRSVIEEQNILVFQLPLPKDEVRGFTIYGEGLPAIIISSKDSINAKIFTLFHEYAHILIGREGMCLPDYTYEGRMESGEKFCNSFSGALLVPKDVLLSMCKGNIDLELIKSLSYKFKVSRYVILKRLEELGRISFKQYQVWYQQMRKEERPTRSFGRSTRASRCVSEKGKRYVSIVFEAKTKGLISFGEMPKYLGLKTKYFNEVTAYLH